MTNRTFTIIKPNAVGKGDTGKILDMIINAGFKIIALKMISLSRNQTERFYEVHRGREFFKNLITFMTSGPVIVAILDKENAVEDYRKLVGSTDPRKAEEGTIRKYFADSLTRNAVHASDSNDNALAEWNHFFSEEEIMVTDYWLPLPAEEIDSK